jgi:transcriptional regulator with XRE-family HTH domain
LRDLRRQAGLTVKLAAGLLEWAEVKLWRIETGQTVLRALDVQAMCAAYGAPPDLTWALAGLASQTRVQGWWRAYNEAIPNDFAIYEALEDAACTLAGYAPFQVPEVPRAFRTVHPLGWAIWKGEFLAPTEEEPSHRNSRTKP